MSRENNRASGTALAKQGVSARWPKLPIFALAAGALLLLLAYAGANAVRAKAASPEGEQKVVPALSPYIDAHTHVDKGNAEESAKAVIEGMRALNSSKTFVLTEPYGPDNPDHWDAEVILPAMKKYPGEIAVLGGGGSLNGMIQIAARTGDAGPEVQKKFKARAEQLLHEGVAGFGELTTEHFSTDAAPLKDYEYAPADGPLMLLLADIAAAHNVPIVLHMEAAPQTIPLPKGLKSPPNPPEIHGNIAAFERLLNHNPKAKIIWAHLGSDNSGYRTPELCDRLLKAHANLYMEMKLDPNAPGMNYPMAGGKIKPEWLKLVQDHPDQIIVGSDQHWSLKQPPAYGRAQQVVLFLNQLPAGLRARIGKDNAARIYGGAAGN